MDIQAIKSEQDITSAVALELRKRAGIIQSEFWESVGSTQASGTLFENNKRKRLPRPVRMLIFLKYVCGMPVGASQDEAATAIRYGREVAAKIEVERAAAAAKEAMRVAEQAKAKAQRLAA